MSYEEWISGESKEPIKKEIHLLDNKYVSKPEDYIPTNDDKNKGNEEPKDKETMEKIKEY